MSKTIRWCAASVLALATAGALVADDDSLLEKALAPEKTEAVAPADPPPVAAQPAQPAPAQPAPAQPVPALGNKLAQPAPGGAVAPNAGAPVANAAPGGAAIGGGVAVGGAAVAGTAVATPVVPRTLFMGAAGVGPFGEPLMFATPTVCGGEAVLLKGAVCGAPVGRVVLQVDRLIFDARVIDWAENGVQAHLPTLAMLGPTHAMLHVIRADGVLADTLPIVLAPAK